MVNHPETGTSHPIKHNDLLSLLLMKRYVLFFLIALLAHISVGCTTVSKPSSLLAVRVSQIEETLRHIEESYHKKDKEGISLHLAPSFQQADQVKEQINQDFTTFSKIKIDMKITRVDKSKKDISTAIYWEGIWHPNPQPEGGVATEKVAFPPLHQSGQAVLVWSLDELPKLLAIRGNTPWGIQQ